VKAAIVIPAFNEAGSIASAVAAVAPYGTPVVVDDGSEDDTGARAATAGAVVVRHEHNGGYDMALATGFAKADEIGAEVIVSTDADGQLNANAIPMILQRLNDVPLVLGIRQNGAARWSEALFNIYARLRFGVSDILCGMKGFRTDIYRPFRAQAVLPSVHTALVLALLRAGTPFALVPVAVRARPGVSRFGGAWRGNIKILRALTYALRDDCLRR
jgi:glycosyltransferase involved in cell wall biosynthesis